MKATFKFGPVLLFAAVVGGPAGAQTRYDFEQLANVQSMYPTIGSYLGLSFSNFWGLDATSFTASYGGGYRATSGNYVLFGRGTAGFTSTTQFFLNSLNLGSGWFNNYPLTVTGLRGGVPVWNRFIDGQMSGPTQLLLAGSQDQGLVDEVRFSSSGYEFYIDDVEVLSSATAAPEPATLALLATGLGGLGGLGAFRRRRKGTEA